MSRQKLVKIHLVLATFILPVVFMFSITGALYTLEIKGSYNTTEHEVKLSEPLQKDLPTLEKIVRAELAKLQEELPSGSPRLKSIGKSFKFEWLGSNRDVILSAGDDPLVATLKIKNTTLHRRLVQLHKAKGGVYFRGFAVVMSVALLLLFASGVCLAWQTSNLRKPMIIAFLLGLVCFVTIMFLS